MTSTALLLLSNHDQQLINMWLHGRSEHTQKAYRRDVGKLFTFTGKGLQSTTLLDLQAFADALEGKDTTRARALNCVKSLFSFAHVSGYIPLNVGAALKIHKLKNTLAQRIMQEEQAIRIVSLEADQRNHAMLRLLYHSGIRASELASLTWEDVIPRSEGEAQITVFGKGGKTRHILLSASMYEELRALGGVSGPVFRSRKGGKALETRQVERIVENAAIRANVAIYTDKEGRKRSRVSPHWLRHAHASHSLDRGAPINLVRETLGHESLATTGKYVHAKPNESSSKFVSI